jgi:chromate transporter
MILGYFRHGFAGGLLAVVGLVLPSLLVVLVLAGLYVQHGGLWWIQALLWGLAPGTLAVMTVSAYRLARHTNERDRLLWALCGALVAVTVVLRSEWELTGGFLLAGLVVLVRRAPPSWLAGPGRAALLSLPAPIFPPWSSLSIATPAGDVLLQMLLVFGQAGILGSGMGMVPLLQEGVVVDTGWLTEPQFLDALAIGIITPGPSATISAFMGYLVAGLPGALVATVGTFGPVCVLTLLLLPWFARHRTNPSLQAFARGAAAASIGALIGTVVVLAPRSITDLPSAGVALASLLILWRYRLPEPLVLAAAGAAGLVLAPLVAAR